MKKTVRVTQIIEVEIDETKFDDEFLEEFRKSFYPFHTIEGHIGHLAQMYARGLIADGNFIEGYGKPEETGIKFKLADFEVEIVE